jgi:Bacterial Ig-like domain (group 2)/IPT/TIG domain
MTLEFMSPLPSIRFNFAFALLLLIGLVACPTTVPITLAVDAFTASEQSLPAGGGTVRLEWNVTGAQSLKIEPDIGVVTGSSIDVVVTKTTTFTLTAIAANGTTLSKNLEITVAATPVAVAVINSFTATPNSLAFGGGKVKLEWAVGNAQSLKIEPGVGTVTGTSADVTVTNTTKFTLTATDAAGGVISKDVDVIVAPAPAGAPKINSFVATPNALTAAGMVKLEWNVTGADTISIDQGVGTVTGTSTTVNVAASKTFKLTATNAVTSVNATVTVTVGTAAKVVTGQINGWNRGSRTLKVMSQSYPTPATLGTGTVSATGSFSVSLADPRSLNDSLSTTFPPAAGCNNPQYAVTPADTKGTTANFEVYNNTVKTGNLSLASSLSQMGPSIPLGEILAVYYFVDRDVKINGLCNSSSGTSSGFNFALDLKEGWNLIWIEGKANNIADVRNTALPSKVQWLLQLQASRVSISPSISSLKIGESTTFTATAYDDANTAIPNATYAWGTSNPNVASITQSGVVTAKSNGQFTVSVYANGANASTGTITVAGLEARGGTLNTGSATLGTAFALRSLDSSNQPPNTDLSVTIRGPAGWNGGQAFATTYPKGKERFWTALENVAPVTGSYTASVNGGSVSFSIDASRKLEPISNIVIGDGYTASNLSATWTLPSGVSDVAADSRLFDKSTSSYMSDPSSYLYSTTSNSWYLQTPLDMTHQNEVQVNLLNWSTYSAMPAQFNVSRASKAIDFKPSIKSLSFNGAPTAGNLRLIIYGRFFANGASVKFGSVSSSSVSVDSSEQITTIVPTGTVGTVDLTVSTAAGTSSVSASTKFSYFAVTEYDTNASSRLLAGANGVIWFIERGYQQTTIGKIQNGQLTRYAMPTNWSGDYISDFTVGPDGQLWLVYNSYYSSTEGNLVKFDPSSNTFGTPFLAPSTGGTNLVSMITTGPDQKIWITYANTNKIAKLNPSDGSLIAEYALPISGGVSSAGEMIAGPNNTVWFTDANSAKVAKVTTAGVVTFFSTSGSSAYGITNGADGNIWVGGGTDVMRFTSEGTLTKFSTVPTNSYYGGIAVGNRLVKGSDNKFWFGSSTLGRMDSSGASIAVGVMDTTGYYGTAVEDLVADTNGKIWYSRNGKIGVLTP